MKKVLVLANPNYLRRFGGIEGAKLDSVPVNGVLWVDFEERVGVVRYRAQRRMAGQRECHAAQAAGVTAEQAPGDATESAGAGSIVVAHWGHPKGGGPCVWICGAGFAVDRVGEGERETFSVSAPNSAHTAPLRRSTARRLSALFRLSAAQLVRNSPEQILQRKAPCHLHPHLPRRHPHLRTNL